MNAASLLVCLCLSVPLGGQGGAKAHDAWFAEDKFQHFFVSFAATTLVASGARTAGLATDRSIALGAGVGAGAGILKEISDARRPGGSASVRDLVWDFAGVGAAVAVQAQAR